MLYDDFKESYTESEDEFTEEPGQKNVGKQVHTQFPGPVFAMANQRPFLFLSFFMKLKYCYVDFSVLICVVMHPLFGLLHFNTGVMSI